ncbi:MAG: 50S ribosome-binding GTPase [Gammaproteobacteria bacterium]|jgi:small GTP-binding protein|nr:50S ribosome-binding GTPase [Gammaproteobacteria bacterium]
MPRSAAFRLFLAAVAFVGLMLLLALILSAAQFSLSLWQQLQAAPLWVMILIATVSCLLLVFGIWLSWRIVRPPRPRASKVAKPLTEAELRSQLDNATAAGVNVGSALLELQELSRRRELEIIHLALFGEISSGKSSLINALLPGARVETDVVGGTTTTIQHYHWQRESGDAVVLVDVPGLNQMEREYDHLVMDEAQRAHVVIFVCDGDLTRHEYQALQPLLDLKKPLIVAFNKLDRYSVADQQLIRQRLAKRFASSPQVSIAGIATQPSRRVIKVGADGVEHEEEQLLPPEIEELRAAVQAALDSNLALLEHLRDSAVFELTARKLEQSKAKHRVTASAELVKTYTRRAVAGGLAAITPGTDILIQGYLGTRMVKSLCELYEVPVREIELQKLLSLTQQQARTALPLLLAVAGNAAKAFPGVGTLAGGLMHAVAYGLIFDALGRAVNRTLETRGELRPAPASLMFRDNLSSGVESQARKLLRLALDVRNEQRQNE